MASISGCRQRFGSNEALQPPGLRMQFSPIVECEIDDHQTASGHFLPQAFAGFDIARCDEHQCDCVQTGIVTQDEEALGGGRGCLDDTKDVMGRCVVKPFDRSGRRGRLEGGSCEFPGFLRACRRGGHHAVRYQGVGCHIGADRCGILLSALHQPACTIFHAGFGTFSLGVTK